MGGPGFKSPLYYLLPRDAWQAPRLYFLIINTGLTQGMDMATSSTSLPMT